MVQDSLVEYISSQVKLGVGRDAIKASLTGAGWQASDVDDTFKKIDGGPSAQPVASASSKPTSAFPATGMSSKANDLPMIRVSDLISASPTASPAAKPATVSPSAGKPTATTTPVSSAPASMMAKAFPQKAASTVDLKSMSVASSSPVGSSLKTGSGLMMKIVLIAVAVVFAGLAGFFYWQNTTLAGKVASLNAMSSDVTGKMAALNSQVAAFTASTTALTASVDTLTAQSNQLSLELSFYAVPPGGSAANIGPVTLSGTISGGGKAAYALTTSYGTKVYVQNSKDAKVIAALGPVVGTSIELAGTYIQGSQNITATAVNGTPL